MTDERAETPRANEHGRWLRDRWDALIGAVPDPDRPERAVWTFGTESVGFAKSQRLEPIGYDEVAHIGARLFSVAIKTPRRIDAIVIPPINRGWRIESLCLTLTTGDTLKPPALIDRIIAGPDGMSVVIPLGVVADQYSMVVRNLVQGSRGHFGGTFWCRTGA